jgi:hypothetical protein
MADVSCLRRDHWSRLYKYPCNYSAAHTSNPIAHLIYEDPSMRQSPLSLSLLILFALITSAHAEPIPTTAPATGLAKMPVKEVTIFKDGHALLLHAGKMPVDSAGNVLLDNLPAPVLGTFWPYSNDPAVKLSAVVAGERRIVVNHTTLAIPELLRANIGAHVVVKTDTDYEGTIVDLPARGIDELRATDPTTVVKLPQDGELLLLKTGAGTKVLNIAQIQSLIFEGDYKTTSSREETRTLLTLKLQWPDNQPKPQADVGMMYLQKGIRWIPSYKISIDGNGHADVQMQATILNELTDLDDVTANLVIGVPTFAFKDTTDPIAIQQVVAQLSPYFQANAASGYAMSNAIMTQGRMGEQQHGGGFGGGGGGGGAPAGGDLDLGPEVTGSQKNEDLFVFTVKHITLKMGERMVIPVTQFTLPYTDVYKLDIPITPPQEIFRSLDTQRQAELATLFHSPKVMHTLRLTNTADMPITTAPALLLRDGKVLAQSMTEYTPQKASLDLPVTAAVDVLVTKSEKETKRTPNAVNWEGSEYARIDLEGSLKLTNHRTSPITLEISRSILGEVDTADNDGKTDMLNVFEDQSFLPNAGDNQPNWFGGYNWPYWWNHFNGIGRVTWKATLDPGKDLSVKYTWHYFWR